MCAFVSLLWTLGLALALFSLLLVCFVKASIHVRPLVMNGGDATPIRMIDENNGMVLHCETQNNSLVHTEINALQRACRR